MHITCRTCGKVIMGDSSEINRKLEEHMEREHRQGYRRQDSWRKCSWCRGTGKDTSGIPCLNCHGSGIV
ncbi:hypothetical protein IJH23_00675 [Candidatus Saccharibacteria bacterium]|nr:hypothetical protein [Candidatus Saccharibacteria bacterium]